MRCRKCDQKAVINLNEHRMALCKDHFLDWLPEHIERTIQKYSLTNKKEKILVAVSGGKDSLSLWDILWSLGYTTEGIHINLGIDGGVGYSTISEQCAQTFALQRNLQLHIVDMQSDYGKTIRQIAERTRHGRQKPCSICGLVKRHILNKFALDGGYDVLTTAHNLDDEAATLMMNSFNGNMDLLSRQYPSLPAHDGFVKKIKPCCKTYERETAAYAILKGINYVYPECPAASGNPQLQVKQILNQLESHQPGLKLSYYLNFLKAKEKGFFPPKLQTGAAEKMNYCLLCGQMTNKEDQICSFCKIVYQ